jgi:hypothetical protein
MFAIQKIVDEKLFENIVDPQSCFCRIQSLSLFPSSLRAIILTKDLSYEMMKCRIDVGFAFFIDDNSGVHKGVVCPTLSQASNLG